MATCEAQLIESAAQGDQEAFQLAWRGLPRFQKGNPFRPWLMRILYRHALDVMEKQRSYLHPISLENVLESGVSLSLEYHKEEQSDLQEQVAQLYPAFST